MNIISQAVRKTGRSLYRQMLRGTAYRDRIDQRLDQLFGFFWKVLIVYTLSLIPSLAIFLVIPREYAFNLWVVMTGFAFGGIVALGLRRGGWRTMAGLSLLIFFIVLMTELVYTTLRVSRTVPRWPEEATATLYCLIFVSGAIAFFYYPWTLLDDGTEDRKLEELATRETTLEESEASLVTRREAADLRDAEDTARQAILLEVKDQVDAIATTIHDGETKA